MAERKTIKEQRILLIFALYLYFICFGVMVLQLALCWHPFHLSSHISACVRARVCVCWHFPATIVGFNVFLISHKVTGVLGDRHSIIGCLCKHQSA